MPTDPESAQRLRRLQGYLAQDPANPQLLADTCDAAIAARELQAAARCMEAAESLRLDPVAWTWRRALAALLAGDAQACRTLVEPLRDAAVDDAQLRGRLQALWLRACHHLGVLAEAWDWAVAQQGQDRLTPFAAGVASLVAIDLGRLEDARVLAERALRDAGAAPPEALVARAYVALADDDAASASRLLEQAAARQPEDGRIWSARGMVSLRQAALPEARERFERAVRLIPQHVGSWHALGWTCLLQDDVAGADAAFGQALERDRNFGENHAAMALVRTLQGRDADAEQRLQRAERLDRAAPTARYVRALRAGELQDAEAIRAFAARLLRAPGMPAGKLRDRGTGAA